MIRLLYNSLPSTFYVAVSGGIDSMVALDFFINGRKNVTVAHFNHGTEFGHKAEKFVINFCKDKNIPYVLGNIKDDRHPGFSQEEHWRNERHNFFYSLNGYVVNAHHLDDAVEWWIFSSLHGKGKLIPYSNKNIIRPFLTTSKESIINWSKNKNVPFMDDPSNKDEKFMRSIIRNKIVPEALRVNPGLRKVIYKKYKINAD